MNDYKTIEKQNFRSVTDLMRGVIPNDNKNSYRDINLEQFKIQDINNSPHYKQILQDQFQVEQQGSFLLQQQTFILEKEIALQEQARKMHFINKCNQLENQINLENQQLQNQKVVNLQQIQELKDISFQLDQLIGESQQKQHLITSREVQVKNVKCNHLQLIVQLKKDIMDTQLAIEKARNDDRSKEINQLSTYNRQKEQENIQHKINQAKIEIINLKKMQSKSNNFQSTEDNLQQNVKNIQNENKELQKEIKLLKRLYHHQGNRLVEIDSSDKFPEQIHRIQEEQKYAQNKLNETKAKIENEYTQISRLDIQIDQLHPIEELRNKVKELQEKEDEIYAIDYEDRELNQQIRENEKLEAFLRSQIENKRYYLNNVKFTSRSISQKSPATSRKKAKFLESSSPFRIKNRIRTNAALEDGQSLLMKYNKRVSEHKIPKYISKIKQKVKGSALQKYVSHQTIGIANDIDKKEKYELNRKLKKDYSFQLLPLIPNINQTIHRQSPSLVKSKIKSLREDSNLINLQLQHNFEQNDQNFEKKIFESKQQNSPKNKYLEKESPKENKLLNISLLKTPKKQNQSQLSLGDIKLKQNEVNSTRNEVNSTRLPKLQNNEYLQSNLNQNTNSQINQQKKEQKDPQTKNKSLSPIDYIKGFLNKIGLIKDQNQEQIQQSKIKQSMFSSTINLIKEPDQPNDKNIQKKIPEKENKINEGSKSKVNIFDKINFTIPMKDQNNQKSPKSYDQTKANNSLKIIDKKKNGESHSNDKNEIDIKKKIEQQKQNLKLTTNEQQKSLKDIDLLQERVKKLNEIKESKEAMLNQIKHIEKNAQNIQPVPAAKIQQDNKIQIKETNLTNNRYQDKKKNDDEDDSDDDSDSSDEDSDEDDSQKSTQKQEPQKKQKDENQKTGLIYGVLNSLQKKK